MITTGTYKSNKTIKIPFMPTFYPTVTDPLLAFVDIIAVKVEGETYDIVNQGNPSGRTVVYFSPLGTLIFPVEQKNKEVFVIYQS